MANLLILGASRGLGAAFGAGLPRSGDEVWLVSRSEPDLRREDGVVRHWIAVDLAQPGAAAKVLGAFGDRALDALVYNAGIWESRAFESDYDFELVNEAETRDIVATNLTSAITCTQALAPNLRRSPHARVVLIGSTSGLDNVRVREAAYVASKAGLRGLSRALREHFRPHGISVTCINPGEIAADVPYERGAKEAISAYGGTRIPVQDIVALVRCVLDLSQASCVTEIDIPAVTDRTV
jgi:short-subunit dehydrogenase